jgi:hypothetical protein
MTASLEPAPLSVSELASQYEDLDRLPACSTKRSRRDTGNRAALRSGGPVDRTAFDAFWADQAAKLNASVPLSRGPSGTQRAPSSAASVGKPTKASVNWGAIASRLNAESGLGTPTRSRAR